MLGFVSLRRSLISIAHMIVLFYCAPEVRDQETFRSSTERVYEARTTAINISPL
jgi:hypothetical protein